MHSRDKTVRISLGPEPCTCPKVHSRGDHQIDPIISKYVFLAASTHGWIQTDFDVFT